MDLDNVKAMSVIGDVDSGKTNLVFHLLRQYKGERKIYLLGYPKQIDDFTNLSNFQDIFSLTDSIIFIDEIQKYIKIYDKKTNTDLLELISLFSHNNNTLIFTTPLSQFITKAVESFIDGWCITKIKNISSLKNGSKPKMIIKETAHYACTSRSLALQPGEYLEYCEKNPIEENGIKDFPFQGIEKDWKMRRKSEKVVSENAIIKKVFARRNEKEKIEDFKELCRSWAQEQVKEGKIKLDKCSKCGAKPSERALPLVKLEIHHKKYIYPFENKDLIVVCLQCHQKEHGRGLDKTNENISTNVTIQSTKKEVGVKNASLG